MRTPDSNTLSRVCDLLFNEAFRRAASAVHLEPKGEGYVVHVVTQGYSEQVMAPPLITSQGLFVHLCQRANVAREVCQGSFGFSYQGHTRMVEMRVVTCPDGKRAVLQLT